LCHLDFCAGKHSLAIFGRDAADVVVMEVSEENEIDLAGLVSGRFKIFDKVMFRPSIHAAGSRIDKDQLLARVDQESSVRTLVRVRAVAALQESPDHVCIALHEVRTDFAIPIVKGGNLIVASFNR
jgi:hypothetical protein